MENKKNGSGIASLLIVIFAFIGVACATVFILKALKKHKELRCGDDFDDLDDLSDLEEDLKDLGEDVSDKVEDVKDAIEDKVEEIKEAADD